MPARFSAGNKTDRAKFPAPRQPTLTRPLTAGGLLGTSTPAGTGEVPAGQVRITPGFYDSPIPPTAAELDPMANHRPGGTLVAQYLDPPRMDINRTLSCTVNSTMDFTKNKLTRGAFGPQADNRRIQIEPDLAESWETSPDGLT